MKKSATSSAHTPGPWKATDWKDEGHGIQGNSPFPDVALVYHRDENTECQANADLIAAAPELLRSCEELLERLNLCCCLHAYDERMIRRAENVLSRAYGKAA